MKTTALDVDGRACQHEAMTFAMPRPSALHERLTALVGRWEGEERMHPSPWDPHGGDASGCIEARIALGGFCVISDYTQRRDQAITMLGHGVYGYDPSDERYTMQWFDDAGAGLLTAARGTWSGDTLVFTNAGAHGHSRYVYALGQAQYDFMIEISADGSHWRRFLEATYVRQ